MQQALDDIGNVVLVHAMEIRLPPDHDEVVAVRLRLDQHVRHALGLDDAVSRAGGRASRLELLHPHFEPLARGLDQRFVAVLLVGAGPHRAGHGRGKERRVEHADADELRAVAAGNGERQLLALHAGRRRIQRHHDALEHDA